MKVTGRKCDHCGAFIEPPKNRVQRTGWTLKGPVGHDRDFCSVSCVGAWAEKRDAE